jgi:hypothetical protein
LVDLSGTVAIALGIFFKSADVATIATNMALYVWFFMKVLLTSREGRHIFKCWETRKRITSL